MTEAMPFLQKYDITFLRPPTICGGMFLRDGGSYGRGWRVRCASASS